MEFLSAKQIQSLNELEMQVYQYVMKHQNILPYMRIRELAAEAHVSTTTILHFCRKVGCEGYSQFRGKIKESIGREKVRPIPDDLAELQRFFEYMTEGQYGQEMEEAASIIARAESVFVIGIGNSGNVGEYGARYFTNLGKFTLFVSDPFYPINLMESVSTAAVLLSVSGETEQILNIANELKQRKCSVISITSSDRCTLAQLSDINMSYYITIRHEEGKIDWTSQIPAIYFLESLAKRVHNRLAE